MSTMFCKTCDSKVGYTVIDGAKVCNCCGTAKPIRKRNTARENLIARLLKM